MRLVEVARQLGLAVDDDRAAAAPPMQLDAVQAVAVGDEETLVDLALAVQVVTALCLAHQRREAVLEYAGADVAQDLLAALPLLRARHSRALARRPPCAGAGGDAHPT
jgi:glutathione S-transferase